MHFRIVLLGRTGNGKSSLGNFILGRNHFKISASCTSLTDTPQADSVIIGRYHLTVVDTPGLFSTNKSMIATALAIQDSLEKIKPGPHIFLMVIKLGRFTNEEQNTIELMKIMFGDKALKYAILVFTHADNAEHAEENPDDLVSEFALKEETKDLYDACGKRYITLFNFEQDERKRNTTLNSLLENIKDVTDNGTKFYKGDVRMRSEILCQYINDWKESNLTPDQIKLILQQLEQKRKLRTRATTAIGGVLGATTGTGAVGIAIAAGALTTVAVGVPVAAAACIAGCVFGAASALVVDTFTK